MMCGKTWKDPVFRINEGRSKWRSSEMWNEGQVKCEMKVKWCLDQATPHVIYYLKRYIPLSMIKFAVGRSADFASCASYESRSSTLHCFIASRARQTDLEMCLKCKGSLVHSFNNPLVCLHTFYFGEWRKLPGFLPFGSHFDAKLWKSLPACSGATWVLSYIDKHHRGED